MSIFLDLISAPIKFLYYVLEIEIGTPANGIFGLFVAFYYLMIFLAILGGSFFFIAFIFNKINEHLNYLVVTNLGESKTIKNLQEKIKTRHNEIEVKKGEIEGWVKELELKEIKLESTGKEVGKLSRQINQKKLSKTQKKIKEYIESRGIDKLIHFTQYKNIESILKHGLMTRSNLDNLSMKYYFNDRMRLDNRENSISLSISYPNHIMLWKYSRDEHYVILALEPSILWEYDCLFCGFNAATQTINKTPIDTLRGLDALKYMFETDKEEEEFRKSERIRSCDPTQEQAEVLVLDDIPIDRIIEIHFNPKNNKYRSEYSDFIENLAETSEFKNTGIKVIRDKYFFDYGREVISNGH